MPKLRIRTLAEDEAGAFVNEVDRRLCVSRLLARQRPAEGEQLLLLTPRDLEMRGCESLFGYADRRRAVAVVSTFRLSADGEQRLAARMMNVIEHERGHLDGLKHCRSAGCIMNVARSAEDVDGRGLERCTRCRQPKPAWPARAAAIAICALAIAAAQGAVSFVKVKSPPFSWRADAGAATVLYRKQPMLVLATEPEAKSAAAALNALYAQITPPPIEATAAGRHAVLTAGGVKLAELDSRSSGGGDPLAYARDWAARAGGLMRAKGEEAEGCPSCHIRRLDEVLATAKMRRQRRW
ncbi:hypothetical protein [uncultured Paludibaculum sp.]|uniref:hypothetical protein n=1 Tax=uncultured Paludibaculum sp. TaxID=1765020 RepID=UPI002AAA961E|nr:hypothetical protein [uncultured Paludibaculum sp.]